MRVRSCTKFLAATVLLVLITWLCPAVLAQEEEMDPKTTTRLALGSTSGTPGTSVVVPIYLTPAEGLEIGRLKLEMNFISVNLKFDKLDAGIAAEMGNVDLSTEVKNAKDEKDRDTTTITVLASFLTPNPPEKGIPAGLLAYMTLNINETARPANITLRTNAEASELKTKQPVKNLRTFDAKVEVVEPGTQPLVVCFFFTH